MIYKRLLPLLVTFLLLSISASSQTGRWEKELSDNNWTLWLDHAALWYNDDIFMPPVDISKLPVNPPSCGWNDLYSQDSRLKVSVPGTVEEHFWGQVGGAVQDTNGNYVGVSWWSKEFILDEGLSGKRITLQFQSVNLRAEVFVNGKLVGYDVIGNTPFEVDATSAVEFGKKNRLDIRITDPVGNFSWDDNVLMRWGKNLIPAVHGFGGITGNIVLRATDAVTVSNIYVQNQPNPKKVNVIVTIDNYTGIPQKGEVQVLIHEKGRPGDVIWSKTLTATINDKSYTLTVPANVTGAKLWELTVNSDIRETNLYEATAKFTSDSKNIVDSGTQRFGFRWFDVKEKDGDKRFYLNGKRVFLIAAMTRGFWPKNGIFPTSEMAKRDMDAMYDLGMNMMLMHRAIGQPGIFDYSDAAGLLTYEEPGGYRVTANRLDYIEGPDDQALRLRSEKLRRMVVRDRSFPSLIIYNLKNEERELPSAEDIADLKMVHSLDPSRIATYNSGNDIGKSGPEYYANRDYDPMELHMLPFNSQLLNGGWWDQHHWHSYSGYSDEMYRNPKFYLRGVINAARIPLKTDSLHSLNKKKIIFFGEEGAFGTIVRLQKIKEELDNNGATGFRELEHIDWYQAYDRFLDETGFRKAYPNVDSLTMSLGRNLHYFHGRNIESIRMGNIADAYNMNGWASASTRTDVVDMYRNPTADASIIRHYTRPLYIAVKLRQKVVPVGMGPIADLYIINELDLKGNHTLKLTLEDNQGNSIMNWSYVVRLKGGEDFGQLLVEDIKMPVLEKPGYYILKATLEANGVRKADGYDDIYAVTLASSSIPKGCQVLEDDGIIKNFLKTVKGTDIRDYTTGGPSADVIIVGNIIYDSLAEATLNDLFKRVQNGSKLIVLSNADKFAQQIDNLLRNRPRLVIPAPQYSRQGFGGSASTGRPSSDIIRLGGNGRLFVGYNKLLNELPQAQSMSWEYQCFYKGPQMGEPAEVAGLRLNTWGSDLIVALGNQGSKEILSALIRVPVDTGSITLSTLNMLPFLQTSELSSIVAKKLFLNLLEY